jgi:hypothetical protein
MEARINYNFHNLEQAMIHLRNGESKRACGEIERELNKFFKDSKCTKVIFTKNTDKLFFGMSVYCSISSDMADDIVNSDRPIRIERYYVEIDSKLLDIGLNSRELVAFLLHEVGHVVNDSTPTEEVRKAIDKYMAEYGAVLDLNKSRDLNYLFRFAIADTIRKSTSIFNRKDEEILADEFVFRCGYGPELESGFRKLRGSALNINSDVDNKFITLMWALRIYTDIGVHRLGAIKVLNRVIQLSGSEIEKKEATDVVKHLKAVNANSLAETACFHENEKGLIARIRRGGLKGIEEDLYEYNMRIRNVETEDEAIVLMRQLNTRMSVLDDYLYNSEGLDPSERKRWEKVLDKYDILRNELAKKTVYNSKQYGIWLDYNYANAMQGGSDPYYR